MHVGGLYTIGLTGGIACGKSVVLTMLAEYGAWTLDADQVTRRLQKPGMPVYNEIVAAFGADILLHPGGPINRPELGAIVFHNPAELQRLEQIVHPAVRAEVSAWLEDVAIQSQQPKRPRSRSTGPAVAVIDAIKLLEGGWKAFCQSIWVVVCEPERQIERLMQRRGLSESEARARIAAQPAQESRLADADVVIDNNGTLEQTREQVAAAWQQITVI